MSRTTQLERLANYLRDHREVTCVEAGRFLSIGFVGRRIYDLKKFWGWTFRQRMVKRKNGAGEDIQVMLYQVKEEGRWPGGAAAGDTPKSGLEGRGSARVECGKAKSDGVAQPTDSSPNTGPKPLRTTAKGPQRRNATEPGGESGLQPKAEQGVLFRPGVVR